MGFLTTKQQLFIVLPIFILIIVSIVVSKKNRNYNKKKFYDQYGEGRVVSNTYNSSCHCHKVKLSNSHNLNLDDIRIISLIKENDSLAKKKNTTFFTVYKGNGHRILYDMYNKKIEFVK